MSTQSVSSPMTAARIEMPNGRRSWTALDAAGDTVVTIRDWIIHLEETNASPNTIRAYIRHVTDFGTLLRGNDADLPRVTIPLYDQFLSWRSTQWRGQLSSPRLVKFDRTPSKTLSPSTRNQIQLAIKSFYRFITGVEDFAFDATETLKIYDGYRSYKPFLEHINQRRTIRRKDRYLSGDLNRVQKHVSDHRLLPEQVLRLIEHAWLARDAFLLVLLYNTGLRDMIFSASCLNWDTRHRIWPRPM